MAGVSVEGKKGGRRSLDSEVNMIPMIDLLMVTISFLLITAVWVHASRMEATAQVPGSSADPVCADCKEEARLHVESSDPSKFVLVWRNGRSVVRTLDVPREAKRSGAAVSFPGLAAKVGDEWRAAGFHRHAGDRRFDHAVVHAPNDMPYAELVAIMDAVAEPKRPLAAAGKTTQTSAFDVTLAVD